MKSIRMILMGAGAAVALALPAAAQVLPAPLPQSKPAVEFVQYGDLCGNWRRECARLYGRQTQAWYNCMGQPQAVADCQGGGRGHSRRGDDYDDYRPRRVASCGTWRSECAKLYGFGTYRWNQCMGQPGAVRACRY